MYNSWIKFIIIQRIKKTTIKRITRKWAQKKEKGRNSHWARQPWGAMANGLEIDPDETSQRRTKYNSLLHLVSFSKGPSQLRYEQWPKLCFCQNIFLNNAICGREILILISRGPATEISNYIYVFLLILLLRLFCDFFNELLLLKCITDD